MRQYNTTLNIEMQNAQEGFKQERSKEARKKAMLVLGAKI